MIHYKDISMDIFEKPGENLQSLIIKVQAFVKEYFPHNYGVMLTGSVLTKNFNSESDIDVIILSNIFRNIFIESYDFDGNKIQAIVMPLYDLDDMICRDCNIGGGIYMHQLYNGHILYDPLRALFRLKSVASTIFKQGPAPINQFQLNQIRGRITSRLEDLIGNDSMDENVYTVLDLYPRIIALFFQINNTWSFSGKLAAREVQKIDNLFHNRLIKSIERLFVNNDKTEIISFTNDLLGQVGGPMRYYSTREYGWTVESNILVVFIECNESQINKSLLNCLEEQYTKTITHSFPDIKIASLYYPQGRIYRSGLYLIHYCNDHSISEDILPFLEMYHLNLYHSQYRILAKSFLYPYNINPIDKMGDDESQKVLIEFLFQIKQDSKNFKIEEFVFSLFQQLHIFQVFDSSVKWNNFWRAVYYYFETENNVKLLPESLYEKLSACILEDFHKRLTEGNCLQTISIPDYTSKLKHIESCIKSFQSASNLGSIFNKFSDGSLVEVSFITYLVETIFNVLNVENKMFIVYLMNNNI